MLLLTQYFGQNWNFRITCKIIIRKYYYCVIYTLYSVVLFLTVTMRRAFTSFELNRKQVLVPPCMDICVIDVSLGLSLITNARQTQYKVIMFCFVMSCNKHGLWFRIYFKIGFYCYILILFMYCDYYEYFLMMTDQWITCKKSDQRVDGERCNSHGVFTCKPADIHKSYKYLKTFFTNKQTMGTLILVILFQLIQSIGIGQIL